MDHLPTTDRSAPVGPHTPTGRSGLGAVDPAALAGALAVATGVVADGDLALISVAGSYLYGLADPARSDLDLRGVYVARTELLLGLGRPAEQYQRALPDLVIYEVGKFLRLAADGNANVLEVLFSPGFALLSDDGAAVVSLRRACVSRRAVSAYLGYALSQHKAAVRITEGTSNGAGRFSPRQRAKHVRHTFRLLAQAEQLGATGELDVVVGPAAADELDRLCGLGLEELGVELEARMARTKAACATGPLADGPDLGRIEACLRSIRLRHLHAA